MLPKLLLTLLVALAIAIPAGAQECICACSEPELATPATGLSVSGQGTEGRYYVDNDLCQPDCLLSVWIYEETNGYPGLQRGDEVVDHTCGGIIPSDTLIF